MASSTHQFLNDKAGQDSWETNILMMYSCVESTVLWPGKTNMMYLQCSLQLLVSLLLWYVVRQFSRHLNT